MALATALRQPLGILVAALLTALVIVSAASAVAPSFTWNLSPSLPRGLYHLDPAASPTRGAIVSFQPPAPAAALIAARAPTCRPAPRSSRSSSQCRATASASTTPLLR